MLSVLHNKQSFIDTMSSLFIKLDIDFKYK